MATAVLANWSTVSMNMPVLHCGDCEGRAAASLTASINVPPDSGLRERAERDEPWPRPAPCGPPWRGCRGGPCRRRAPSARRRRKRRGAPPLRATPKVPRRVRGAGAGRRSCAPGRARTRCRAGVRTTVAAPRGRARPLRRGNRSPGAGCRRPASCSPRAPVASRSCKKARNGAIPVPGPIMMTGRSGAGRRKASAGWT